MKDSCLTSTLRKHLQGKNISAVSREVGIPTSLIHDWVKGRRMPSLKNIHYVKKLAEYLGISLEEILLGQSDNSACETSKDHVVAQLSFEDEGKRYQINIVRKLIKQEY